MRLFTAAGLLTSVMILPAAAVSITMTPPPKVLPQPAPQTKAKPACPCDCPKPAKHQASVTRRHRGAYYHYAAAAPFVWQGYRQEAAYLPPAGPSRNLAYEQGLHIDNEGWSGGVGTGAEGGGFGGGYGQVHFANGGSVENGPTYNDYNQSFQFDPSQPGPFQPRLMGGFAPSSNSGSR